LDIIKSSPGIAATWQLHYSAEAGASNASVDRLANLQGPDAANFLKLTAQPDGSFGVFNSRTKETKNYSASH
jgi:hypothetical protein